MTRTSNQSHPRHERGMSTRKSGGRSVSKADAIKMLKEDHAKVKGLFKKFESASSESSRQELAAQICTELTIHTTLEEEIFYPAARAALDEPDLLDEAEVEHASAKELISQIEAGQPGDELWDAKVTVLGEYVEHHIKEEEKEMFPKIRKADLDLKALGATMAERKEELQSAS